ncbi:MAG: AAA family ATPase [Nitrososphaera sp.]
MSTRAGYNKHAGLIRAEYLAPETRTIFQALSEYYELSPLDHINFGEFGSWFKQIKLTSANQAPVFDALFTKLACPEEEGALSSSAVAAALRDRYYANKLADLALRVADNSPGARLDDALPLLEARDREAGHGAIERLVVSQDMDALVRTLSPTEGLMWRLRELNVSLGPIRGGDLLCIGARPEVGKTTMLASEATYMAPQLPIGSCVLWFNNEEQGHKVKLRCIQAALGATSGEIRLDPGRATARYLEAVGAWDRIVIVDSASITTRMVERAIKQYPPGLIIFDQLRKLRGFARDDRNDVQRLAQLYQFARRIAKECAPVITVHQAGGAAAGELYPRDDMLEGCKTEIQGELDVQIMIGRSDELGREHARGLNIVKNKLASPGDEAYRHAQWEVTIRPDIARFESAE